MTVVKAISLIMMQIVFTRSFPIQKQGIAGRSATLCRFGARSFAATKLRNQNEASTSSGESSPAKSTDLLEEYRNENNVRDQVFSAISGDGSVKVTACTARNLVNEFMLAHTLTATPADALGRAVICALMMSNGMQDEQSVQLTFNGEICNGMNIAYCWKCDLIYLYVRLTYSADGPIRGIVAISTGLGEVRGYVGSPMLGEMTLSEAVGLGSVQVVKNHPDWPNPYNGITAVRHGDIDRDIGTYLPEYSNGLRHNVN